MECLDRVRITVRRVWIRVSTRLGLRRKTGLRKLRKEVNACEYEDVHVMWEMLRKSETGNSAKRRPPQQQRRHGLPLMRWAAPYHLCDAF